MDLGLDASLSWVLPVFTTIPLSSYILIVFGAKFTYSFEHFLDDLRAELMALGVDLVGAKQEYDRFILLHSFSKHLHTISATPVDPVFPDGALLEDSCMRKCGPGAWPS